MESLIPFSALFGVIALDRGLEHYADGLRGRGSIKCPNFFDPFTSTAPYRARARARADEDIFLQYIKII